MGKPVDPTVAKLASSITAILMLGGALLWCKHSGKESSPTVEPAVASVPPAPAPTPVAPPPSKPIAPCDADALWFTDKPRPFDPIETRKNAVATMATWSVDCRQQAMAETCSPGCDDLITDMIIDAEPDPKQKLALVRVRRDKNTEALAVSLKFIAKVKKFVAHAKALSTVPRGDDGCIARMLNDYRTIDALTAELNAIKGAYGVAVLPTRGVLSYGRSCVDCADDRSLCTEMLESDKTTDENVSEIRQAIRADTARLGGK